MTPEIKDGHKLFDASPVENQDLHCLSFNPLEF